MMFLYVFLAKTCTNLYMAICFVVSQQLQCGELHEGNSFYAQANVQ